MTEPARKVVYTAKVHTTGGRDGVARSSDGRLQVRLSSPGLPGDGTNPEQLFAAGWSACFEGAIELAARRLKITLPQHPQIDATVELCLTGDEYTIQARLDVTLPGLDRDVALPLIDAAHRTCPYSKATRGNIDAIIHLI